MKKELHGPAKVRKRYQYKRVTELRRNQPDPRDDPRDWGRACVGRCVSRCVGRAVVSVRSLHHRPKAAAESAHEEQPE